MSEDPVAFGLALLFFAGVVLLFGSAAPALRARFPGALGWGFALAAFAVVAMFVVALLGGAAAR